MKNAKVLLPALLVIVAASVIGLAFHWIPRGSASNNPAPDLTPSLTDQEATSVNTPLPATADSADAMANTVATPTLVPEPTAGQVSSGPTASPQPELSLEEWKTWPVIPRVSEEAKEIYQKGLSLGNDPHAFSILGDCQSLPEYFMGVFEDNPLLIQELPEPLQETVTNFTGSFSRQSPTVKLGTTTGAILWREWHEGKYGCRSDETPLACELRIHRPSLVFINLGTHYETRNIDYLRKILQQLIDQGAVPILATKADNREGDDRLNKDMASLAYEYHLPLWNFWADVIDLPNHGVGLRKGEEFLGEIYLSEEGLERHRLTALQALDAVWRAVR